MKVYCLLACYHHEGHELCGVFDCEQKAQEAQENLKSQMGIGPDEWEVQEVELNGFADYGQFFLAQKKALQLARN